VELAGDEGLQLAAVGGELGAARLQRRQQALGVVEHQLARRSGLGGGGRGGLGLRGGRERRHGEQGGSEREGRQGTGHSVGSVGDGVGRASGAAAPGAGAAPSSPAPLNMYLPTIWIRSTAGWVYTSSSPGLSTSMSPPGSRPT